MPKSCRKFLRNDSTDALLEDLARRFPAEVLDLGKSGEGRRIRALQVKAREECQEGDLEVLLMGGMHAREWITMAALSCLLEKKLLEALEVMRASKTVCKLVVLPIVNPDGYAFTRTTVRHWRKTREVLTINPAHRGVDLNRNFGVRNISWGFGNPTATWSELYQGHEPFSSVEARIVRDLVLSMGANSIVLDIHCCARVVLPIVRASNKRKEQAKTLAAASGGKLSFRERSDVIDKSNTGIAIDWMELYGNIRAAFVVEVPGKENSAEFKDLFKNPATDIMPTTDLVFNLFSAALRIFEPGATSLEPKRLNTSLHLLDFPMVEENPDDTQTISESEGQNAGRFVQLWPVLFLFFLLITVFFIRRKRIEKVKV